jgi:hypothetical protein
MNGLKHGRYSKQHKRLAEMIARDPECQVLLLDIARRNRKAQDRQRARAIKLLHQIADRIREDERLKANERYELNQRIPPVSYLEDPDEK